MNLKKYKDKLEDLIYLQNQSEKLLLAASIIYEYYQDLLFHKKGYKDNDFVLVGGLSLDFYTDSDYSTADIDLIIDDTYTNIFSETMENLKFIKQGKDWFRNDLKIFVETPSPPFAWYCALE